MNEASRAFSFGRKIFVKPEDFACWVIGRIPLTGLICPVSESSPTMIEFWRLCGGICWLARRMEAAMGKSNKEPCFFIWAGAKLIVFRVCGK